MWGSWLSDGASPPSACLPACCPGPGTVPGIGFKLVNNFTFGLVDVNRARRVLPTCFPASTLVSFHDAPSPGGLSLSFSSYPQGPVLLCPRVPLGCLVQALYHFSLLCHAPLCFISLLCPVLSSSIPTLCQLLLPSRPRRSFREAPVWDVQTKPGVVGQVSSYALSRCSPCILHCTLALVHPSLSQCRMGAGIPQHMRQHYVSEQELCLVGRGAFLLS